MVFIPEYVPCFLEKRAVKRENYCKLYVHVIKLMVNKYTGRSNANALQSL